jgi:N-acetylglutamate synthase-like GNAT family acetyltransferase
MSAIGRDDINIRRMTISDIDSIVALINKTTSVKTHGVYQDLIAYDLGGPLDLSLAAEAEGQIVGLVIAHLEYIYVPLVEVCLIHVIIVDPEYQRHNIGSALVRALSSHCHLKGINKIRALVRQGDDELQKFIEHLGFHPSSMVNWDKTCEA